MLFVLPAIIVILGGAYAVLKLAAVDPVGAQWLALGIMAASVVAGLVVLWLMQKKLRR
jgi:hypothetical protein